MEKLKKAECSDILLWLPGKTSNDSGAWLPSWQHMMDTADIMEMLARYWLPDSVVTQLCQTITYDELACVTRFLALVHDIGKLTPVFASKLMPMLPDVREHLRSRDFFVPETKRFIDAGRSPHALAGAVFLHQEGLPQGIISVVAAHHGRPVSMMDMEQFDDDYPYKQHYFGLCGQRSPEGQSWHKVRRAWLDFAMRDCGYGSADDLPELNQRMQMLASGLLVVADWIASNARYFPLLSPDDSPHFGSSQERAERAWAQLRLPERWLPDCCNMDAEQFSERFGDGPHGFEPNSVQQSVLSVVNMAAEPGIFILEAQMGVGKTEAALAAAEVMASRYKSGGVFFGLPTQATANGIFPRLANWAGRQSETCENAIRLAHGMATMNDEYNNLFRGNAAADDVDEPTGLVVHRWFEGRKKALLADFVIGTVDQLLMASLRQRHVMLRHLGLAGKVVIIDEVHAYDAYMNVYLENALRWLGAYGVPVILLSATLPISRRKALMAAYTGTEVVEGAAWVNSMAYPLLTWSDGGKIDSVAIPTAAGDCRRVELMQLHPDEEGGDARIAADFLAERLRDGGCAVVVMNTVRRAQAMAHALRVHFPNKEVMLVHAQFLMEDRAEWEQTLMRRIGRHSAPESRDNLIIVGTQVLEQSLDIDADVMITDLCPMDLLLQRMGRLHRHERMRPSAVATPYCAVLSPADGFEPGAEAIYGRWLLMRTESGLPQYVHLPNDIPSLVQAAYAVPENIEPDTPEAEAYRLHEEHIKRQQGRAKSFCLQATDDDESIDGMLDTQASDDERVGDATVRDGESSVEVLCMVRHADGQIGFVPWHERGRIVPRDSEPGEADALAIARQRIRLPQAVCGKNEHLIGETIALLEESTRKEVPEWLRRGVLKGELFLFLDESCSAMLRGYHLRYSRAEGLVCWKEEHNG